jgi:hypothetical protein
MKKVLATLVVAAVAITMAVAQPAPASAAKLSGMLEVDSILAGTDGASSAVISTLSFDLNAGNFGAVLGFKPSATNMANGPYSFGGLGNGYPVSPFSILPDDFYLWTNLFEGKAKLMAGQINDGTFAPHTFVLGGNAVNKITTSDEGQGIEIQARPMDGLILGVYVPLSDGDYAYRDLSVAVQYDIKGAAIINAGFIGNNKNQLTTADEAEWAAFGTVELTGIQKVAAYVGAEYLNKYVNAGNSIFNMKNIAVGVKYTGIDKLSLALDGELGLYDENATLDSSFGGQIAANAEYAIKGPYAAGLTAVFNQDAMGTVNASGAPWAAGQIGDDNCVMFEPYFAINPMGPPPFAKVTVGVQLFYQTADFSNALWSGTVTHSKGDFFWAVPVCVTVIL